MPTKLFIISILMIAIFAVMWTTVTQERGSSFDLAGNVVEDERVFFNNLAERQAQDTAMNNATSSDAHTRSTAENTRILITDGVQHTVPLADIRSSNIPQDGIPSIDAPKFISVQAADVYTEEEGLGIAISVDGIHRFYPNQILARHNIVNDIIGSTPFVVTYSPLSGAGIVFSSVINGEPFTFGTSGKVWNSNLVLYDRKTNSYWSQLLGQSIVGDMAGEKLVQIASQTISYSNWKKEFPDGKVLSRDIGFFQNYTIDPYSSYYTNSKILFPVDATDDRYREKAMTYGITIGTMVKAYPQEELEKRSDTFEDIVAGHSLMLTYDKNTGVLTILDKTTTREIIPIYCFWFSWIAMHPYSEVFTAV